ncbi:crAss001_48 related protein [Acinetobacter variabilis]|uniref:Uncharacterized protein n=1 Tax=Acinetobacter variabilis TaxID=70346 RepID=N8X1D2_9GAMM|nr:hypothetical protein [Acinetobacter variabilis]ENV00955.1 hypothetical protein F969_00041 [Acinetobacter variabilis]
MNKYVKNPVEITAIQYQWDDEFLSMDEAQANIAHFVGGNKIAFLDESILLGGVHGQVEVKRGDWIIKQNDQDFYPCSDAVFQQNYTAAPSTWLDRVKQEQAELQIKLDALDKTLNVERKPDFITDQQWIFMTRQQFHMRQYNQILKDRIADASPDTNLTVRIDDTGIIGGFGLHSENLAPSITADKVYIKPSLCGSEDQI